MNAVVKIDRVNPSPTNKNMKVDTLQKFDDVFVKQLDLVEKAQDDYLASPNKEAFNYLFSAIKSLKLLKDCAPDRVELEFKGLADRLQLDASKKAWDKFLEGKKAKLDSSQQ